MKKKYSLKKRIIYAFLLVAILSSLTLGIFSFMNIAYSLKSSAVKNATNTLTQVDNNINILLESYEDVLYQIYTSDDVISNIDNINKAKNSSVAKSNLRRYMRGLVNSKDFIRSITIITSSKDMVAYDQMTNKTYENGWMDTYSMNKNQLYDEISQNALLHILSPEYGTRFANEDYYLLHIGHRFVDYRDIRRDVGVVIISIDERMLQNCCNIVDSTGDFIFIAADDGQIISCGKNQKYVGTKLEDFESDKDKGYEEFLTQELGMSNFDLIIKEDQALGWNIVCAKDKTSLTEALKNQLILILVVEGLVFILISNVILKVTDRLASSVEKVVEGMQNAKSTDRNEPVEIDDSMPLEIEAIAISFNEMIERLDKASESERNALIKQREAQITALEAQINPHFLYNTLDTINWMAIDKEEYGISNAIGSLAAILRYAISDSSALVTIADEVDWLKQYVYLQQVRLKNKFICEMDVEPEAKSAPIHKLLLQPFVENAIVHGFEQEQEFCKLQINVSLEDNLMITIQDNGKGIPAEIVEKCNNDQMVEENEKKHIGMANAITRLRMYYGDSARVKVESILGIGSKISIAIPQ